MKVLDWHKPNESVEISNGEVIEVIDIREARQLISDLQKLIGDTSRIEYLEMKCKVQRDELIELYRAYLECANARLKQQTEKKES